MSINKIVSLFVFSYLLCSAACYAAECNIYLSRPVVDYQNISSTDFSASYKKWNALDTREVQVSTQCSEPVQIENVFSGFGTGKAFPMGEHSAVEIIASDAYLDGQPVSLGKDSSQGAFTLAHGSRQRVLILAGNSIVPVINGEIPTGQQLVYRLTIKPLINDADLHPKDQNQIESNISTSVVFQ